MIFKWVFKSAAAILIVTNTWNIVMGVFDMAQSVVAQAAGIIGSDASIDISSVLADMEPRLMEMDLGPLFGLWFQSLFKVKELQTEYAKLLEEKKKTYAEYRRSREEMRELLTAKANVDRVLKMEVEQDVEKEKDHGQR